MKITYLDNSGFSVEMNDLILVFDEYNPNADENGSGVVTEEQVASHERSLLLLSHSHHDHYCKEVLALPFRDKLISCDFPEAIEGKRLNEGSRFEGQNVVVTAYGSTDMGVSYLVEADGKRIFHAGDYNLWHWEDESTKEEIDEATRWFERILLQLTLYEGCIDVAFFPLDPRMGKNTSRGIERFMKEVAPKVVIPMHFQGDTALVENFAKDKPTVRPMTRRGQTLEL